MNFQEQEQARPGWASLSAQERMDNERQYAHSGQLAKYEKYHEKIEERDNTHPFFVKLVTPIKKNIS